MRVSKGGQQTRCSFTHARFRAIRDAVLRTAPQGEVSWFSSSGLCSRIPASRGGPMSAAFDVTKPLPGASFGATVRLTKPLSQGIPDGLPAVLADANGLMLIPGLQEIADKPELLVGAQPRLRPGGRGLSLHAHAAQLGAHDGAGDLPGVEHRAGEPQAAAAARSAGDGRRPAAGAVSAPQGLAHRPELSPAAARHLAVLCRDAGRARPRPDAVRRRHGGLCGAAAAPQGQGRRPAGPALPAGHGALARGRARRPYRHRPAADRALAAAAGRARAIR